MLALRWIRGYIRRMASFTGLGRALRWIRQRQGKKQYEVAEAARVTKAMLSSYENEKQRPAIDTLERILDSLEIDLDYLAYAIRVVRQEEDRRSGSAWLRPIHSPPPAFEHYRSRALPRPGPPSRPGRRAGRGPDAGGFP